MLGDIRNVTVFVIEQLDVVAGATLGNQIGFLGSDGTVRAGIYMSLNNSGKIHIADNVAIRKYNVFFPCALDI